MKTEEYLYFTECSKVSFTKPNKRKKFLKWSGIGDSDFQCSNEVVDLLGYLLYDQIEEIVSKIKKDRPEMLGPILPEHIHPFVNNCKLNV
eukprot:TRINITY_DN108537_c0_g1_i1.p1 TRINITY_DN108537_c0_g1~~TRINITY_DN108537_c0_g1_i1.p1  ORF type:complete len:90 (+),score=18.51 TRINITY_DN108537_c0_g1_i1:294-563(+)